MEAHDGILVEGTRLFTPQIHTDDRGFFTTVWDTGLLPSAPYSRHCVARSRRGVIRGLHVRRPPGEAKLIRCSRGIIFDVVLDLRPTSPTFMAVAVFELDDTSQVSLYIPAGCAHGYQALSGVADVTYRIDGRYDLADHDLSVAWHDPELGISWPLEPSAVSERDSRGLLAAEAVKLL